MVFEVATVLCAVAAAWVVRGPGRSRVPGLATEGTTGGTAPMKGPVTDLGEAARATGQRTAPRLLGYLGGFAAAALLVALLGAVGGLVVAGAAAFLWLRARRARESPGPLPITDDLPVLIGLLASGIRAGATVPACLTAVSGAARGGLGTELAVVSERLRLGAEPAVAWQRSALPEPLVEVGRDLARAAETGAPVADLLDRHVADLRRRLRSQTTARIERLGVLVVAPLGLCFLPAFILIGVVPMAAELLTEALSR